MVRGGSLGCSAPTKWLMPLSASGCIRRSGVRTGADEHAWCRVGWNTVSAWLCFPPSLISHHFFGLLWKRCWDVQRMEFRVAPASAVTRSDAAAPVAPGTVSASSLMTWFRVAHRSDAATPSGPQGKRGCSIGTDLAAGHSPPGAPVPRHPRGSGASGALSQRAARRLSVGVTMLPALAAFPPASPPLISTWSRERKGKSPTRGSA